MTTRYQRWERPRDTYARGAREQENVIAAREADPNEQRRLKERHASGIERLRQIVQEGRDRGMTDSYVALITVRQAKQLLGQLGEQS